MSRILFWSPNYAPEPTGIPPLVTDACEWLARQGHEVEAVTALPNYPTRRIERGYRGLRSCTERRGPVLLHRSWLRVRPGETFVDKVLYELTFATWSLPAAARRIRAADVLVAVVPSLVAAMYGAALRRVLGGPRLVVWLQDLVLQMAPALADLSAPRRTALALAAMPERAAMRAADRLVVCSPGFRDHLVRLGVDRGKIRLVYNWVDAGWIVQTPPTNGAGLRALYAGNLGYTQGFETLVEAARSLDGGVEVEIVGEGNASATVRSLAAGVPNVRVRPPVPHADFPALLASADAHLVIQRRVGAGANFPSKIASYLASGRPIVASMSFDSPAAQLLRTSGAALLVPPEEPASLAAAIERLRREPALREQLGSRGREFALQLFDREASLRSLESAILS